MWLALGRAANELHDIGLDLEEHLDTLTATCGPVSAMAATSPAPAPLVVRRHR
ncbi:hypothetical protein [Streptomyces sp. NPDC056632]|uniref:hypothetical protein n=1 Tax=Streptomyces sp. NPDC056632 TaxID=3345884 RepID=UPI0036818299